MTRDELKDILRLTEICFVPNEDVALEFREKVIRVIHRELRLKETDPRTGERTVDEGYNTKMGREGSGNQTLPQEKVTRELEVDVDGFRKSLEEKYWFYFRRLTVSVMVEDARGYTHKIGIC